MENTFVGPVLISFLSCSWHTAVYLHTYIHTLYMYMYIYSQPSFCYTSEWVSEYMKWITIYEHKSLLIKVHVLQQKQHKSCKQTSSQALMISLHLSLSLSLCLTNKQWHTSKSQPNNFITANPRINRVWMSELPNEQTNKYKY